MMEKVIRQPAVRAAAVAVVIVVACSANTPSEKEDGQAIDLNSDPPPPTENWGNVAHAATVDAGEVDTGEDETPPPPSEAIMPPNPSHISVRLPKVPKVEVRALNNQPYPYPYTVTEEEDATVVTLYLPQSGNTGIRAKPVQQVGVDSSGEPVYEQVAPEISFSVEPEAKLGTNELCFGGSHTTINFSGNAQNVLQLGENTVQGPVTDEFIGGQMQSVLQGVFEAPQDMVCNVDWVGCERVYSFLDGPPECRTGPFQVRLRAGQKLGVYPVTEEGSEPIRIILDASPAQTEE